MVTKNEAAYPVMKYNCNVNVQPNLESWNFQTFIQNGNYKVDDYILDSDIEGLSRDSTFRINVPPTPPDLETWNYTAHRFTSNGLYTVSNYMADNNKPGITKESQFDINVPTNDITPLTNQTIDYTGHFEFLPPNGYDGLTLVSGTVDMTSKILQNLNWEPTGLPSTFRITDFNQANNTDYIGVKEITCLDTNIQPQQNQIIIDNVQYWDPQHNNPWIGRISANSNYTINDTTQPRLFIFKYTGYYRIAVFQATTYTVTIKNNTSDIMYVLNFYLNYSNTSITFHFYNSTTEIFFDIFQIDKKARGTYDVTSLLNVGYNNDIISFNL